MFSTITLIHNQEKNLHIILEEYSRQPNQPFQYIFVLDRCSDRSEDILKDFSKNHNVVIVKNENGFDFQAGYCRDLGLLQCEGSVLFLDGDCIPSKNLFGEYAKELSSEEPSIVVAKRISTGEDGTLLDLDSREKTPWFVGMVFNSDENTIIKNKELALKRMITWSCCLGLNRKAINLIINFNSNIGYSDRLFPNIFDGIWGGEDDHVGLIAMLLDIRFIGLSTTNHVTHIWHPSRENTNYENSYKEAKTRSIEYAKKINSPGLKYLNVDITQYVTSYIDSNRKNNEIFVETIDEPLDDEP